LRETLYEKRKEYLLARLEKECVILENKVRFILAVNASTIKISNVKRKALVIKLKELEFKTMSEINDILPDRTSKTVVNADDPLNQTNETIEQAE